MNKKTCIWAGIFVVAMFLLTTVPTNAISVPQLQIQQRQYVNDEPYNFPQQLPPDTSSLSCITKRKAMDLWHMCVYDVGFSYWAMCLRDGPTHWLFFDGTISVIWHKGQEAQNINHPLYHVWSNYVVPGFTIDRLELNLFPEAFYTASVGGYIFKDMGGLTYINKEFTGYNYYLENDMLQNPIMQQQAAIDGSILE